MVKALNAQIAAFIASLGGVTTPKSPTAPSFTYDTALSTAKNTNSKIDTFLQDQALAAVRDLNSRVGGFLAQNSSSNVTVNIDASNMVDSDRMVDVVQNAFLTIQRQGGSTVPAGAY